MINWKVRARNPTFWLGVAGALGAPVFAYMGVEASDLDTWAKVGDLVVGVLSNPFLLGLVACELVGVVSDPTTAGIGDSSQAMTYEQPKARHMKKHMSKEG